MQVEASGSPVTGTADTHFKMGKIETQMELTYVGQERTNDS